MRSVVKKKIKIFGKKSEFCKKKKVRLFFKILSF